MSGYRPGQNPNSLANLGKPKTKAGRFNFTLSFASAEWLKKQTNKSAAIDQLIQERKNMAWQILGTGESGQSLYQEHEGVVTVLNAGMNEEDVIEALENKTKVGGWELLESTSSTENIGETIERYGIVQYY